LNTASSANARIRFIIAAAAFGTISIFVKAISLPSAEISLYRAGIACAVLSFYLLATGRFCRIATLRKKGLLLFISGAAIGVN